MMLFITGGSASGKSEYAEQRCLDLAGRPGRGSGLVYLATMMRQGKSSEERIRRHRSLREGKGFRTLEYPVGIGQASVGAGDIVLLECLSNLLANEMFSGAHVQTAQVAQQILSDVRTLREKTKHLIVVSNQIFSDGETYDPLTEEYRKILGWMNTSLAQTADEAWEVVCGIPLKLF